ncbi:MAG: hypothetical protein ACR2ME_00440, partial [Acidimicrobiia bacterium]
MTSAARPYSASPELVRRALEGKKVSIVDLLVSTSLLVALLTSLAVLLTLLIDVVNEGLPVLSTRLVDFVTSPL